MQQGFWGSTICLLLISLASCHNGSKSSVKKEVGFYFWHTRFALGSQPLAYAKDLHARFLYVRLFDVDTVHLPNGKIGMAPISIIQSYQKAPDSMQIIPVVYFTRQAMKHMPSVDSMASKLNNLVTRITIHHGWTFREIQWDFDWTPTTKMAYFDLLKKLKQYPLLKDKLFSATIRLHQIKNRGMAGIPPVDKGLLMCYNMGDLKNYSTRNSILDQQKITTYLSGMKSYPMPLDLAFPLFQWGLQFRQHQFVSILNSVSYDSLSNNPSIKQQGNGNFMITNNMQLQGFELQSGDEVRFEQVSFSQLKEAATFLSSRMPTDSFRINFFHLDTTLINKYPVHELQKIVEIF